jgi:hypothetical protein
VLSRKIGSDDLRADICRIEINAYALPTRTRFWVCQEATEDL